MERFCAYDPCGKPFVGTWKKQRFCSVSCSVKARAIVHPEAVKQYLLNHITIPDNPSHCWPWQGALNDAGYSMAHVRTQHIRAHRLSYEVFIGPIPCDKNGEELDVLHEETCTTRACINPAHLRPGTNADNVKDRVKFGHQPRGSVHYMAELTEIKVAHILRWRYERNMTYEALAEYYGVDIVTIHDIIQRKTWTHVLPEQFPAPEGDARYTLTEDDVRTMRRLHADDGWTYAALGCHFHVDQAHVRNICLRRSWTHLE